jgi:hypothetical protein
VKAVPPIIAYTVLRLALFVLPLVALLLLHVTWWIAVVAASLIGLCLSYIMLAKPRHAVAQDIYERRHRDKPPANEDDDAEDAVIERAQTGDRRGDGRWRPSDTD